MTCATSEAGLAYHSGAFEFILSFQCGSCYEIFSFLCSVMSSIVCLFVLFLLVIVLPALSPFTTSDFPYRTFNIVLLRCVKTMCIQER